MGFDYYFGFYFGGETFSYFFWFYATEVFTWEDWGGFYGDFYFIWLPDFYFLVGDLFLIFISY